MTRARVVVVLRQLDPDGDRPGDLMSEWVHDGGQTVDEDGITLIWEDGYSSFFPWTSVLRVDQMPCNCMECKR